MLVELGTQEANFRAYEVTPGRIEDVDIFVRRIGELLKSNDRVVLQLSNDRGFSEFWRAVVECARLTWSQGKQFVIQRPTPIVVATLYVLGAKRTVTYDMSEVKDKSDNISSPAEFLSTANSN